MNSKMPLFNGVPKFSVDADDFMYIAACATMKKRLLSKNIKNEDLKEFYINSRSPKFAIEYDGVILKW